MLRPASKSRPATRLAQALGEQTLTWSVADYRAALATLAPDLQKNLADAWGAPEHDPSCSRRRVPFRGDPARQGDHRRSAGARRSFEPRCRLSRSLAHAPPRLCRVLSVAPERKASHAHDPHGRARHAGMAARQIRRAVGIMLARSADRRLACDLSVHRQRSRRGGAGQAAHRRGHDRSSPAAAREKRAAAKPASGSNNCSTNIRPPTASIRRGASVSWPRSATKRAPPAWSMILACLRPLRRGSDPADRPLCLRPQGEPVRRRPACLRSRRVRRRGTPCLDRRAVGQARRAGPGRFALSRTERRAADADAICSRSIRARCRPARRMRKGSSSPRSCCAAICRITATGRRDWWSISGVRRRCGPPAKNSPWRCISPASRRAGTRPPAASPASRSFRRPRSAGPASM